MNLAEFIKKATQIHGDIYDYSEVVLTGAHNKIIIIDPEFGPFQQTAASHLNGVGCPARAKYGFDPNIPAIVYYLRISGGKAYKIGITNRDVVSRYQKSDLDQIHIVKIWSYKVGGAAKLYEAKLLEKFKNAKYSGPDLLSSGNSELFSFDVLNLDT